jgi:hypothetical protein
MMLIVILCKSDILIIIIDHFNYCKICYVYRCLKKKKKGIVFGLKICCKICYVFIPKICCKICYVKFVKSKYKHKTYFLFYFYFYFVCLFVVVVVVVVVVELERKVQ